MCGIFGYISKANSNDRGHSGKILDSLYKMSETRGKEASGLILLTDSEIQLIKDAVPASKLIKRSDFKELTSSALKSSQNVAAIGHSRLVTNGQSNNNENNQPVYSHGIVGVHNGIITNENELWDQNQDLNQAFEIDTEIFFQLLSKYMQDTDLTRALQKTFNDIEGVANVALMFNELNVAILATNNGSLYYLESDNNDSVIFASEKYILEQCFTKCNLEDHYTLDNIKHIPPNSFLALNLSSFEQKLLNFEKNQEVKSILENKVRKVIDLSQDDSGIVEVDTNPPKIDFGQFYEIYEENKEKISLLRRCSRCILPETMPFISFDNDGVCNYCKSYKPHKIKGIDELKKILPKTNNDFDCLVTLSGGRDSSYGLHFIKEEMGLNPVTYTYDWGMVTDLARRNQMRMCGSLKAEHILVSADIQEKRNNIRKNVAAWLKRPELGMIPLFMAGDKQYFYWSNKIAEQTKVSNIILCENLLETTKFKAGFCGIKPMFGTENTYTLSLKNKLQMIVYYGKNFLRNPAYLNSSLRDTVSAFSSYYVMDHNFINLFDYIEWDEDIINDTLINKYKWETSSDTKSTWRIGDGTAAFYNYIYYTMAGMTENDTFRSNQIREGKMSRENALRLSERENSPRFESIKWYLDTINLDFNETIETINNAKKLY